MDLSLRINTDFDKASEAFKKLASESEETRQKIEKFSSAFQAQEIDKFIDKQKLLEASLTGTRGSVAAMTTEQKNYQREIERLIKSGLGPESEAIQRLRSEEEKLAGKIKEVNDIQKAQEGLMRAAETAATACFAAIGAGIAAVGAMTQKTAEMGDQFAKTSRVIGMSAEAFQELDYAAKMNGVNDLGGSLERLNKTVADVKSGSGALTTYLKENDKQLLSQVQNVNSNEEAFNLLMDAISKAPDEFTRAELATAAFGKSGQELILMANDGTDGIAALREEARKYGVISNEAAANSEAYLDAQARLQKALTGVGTELTSKLLPGLTDSITKVADFIASIDNWEGILTAAGYALAGVTAGLTAFLVITKGAAMLQAFTTAFKTLNAAIASNPIGAIAVVITAVLIPALIALYKNWDTVQTYLQQGIARLEFGFKWFGSVIKEGLIVAFNAVKIAGATLLDFIYGNIVRGVSKLLDVMSNLPFVGEMFLEASKKVGGLGNAIGDIAENIKQQSREAIQAAHDEQNATQQALEAKLTAIDTEAQTRRAEIEARKKQVEEEQQVVQAAADNEVKVLKQTEDKKSAIIEEHQKSISERLNEIALNSQQLENQIHNERLESFLSFLDSRAELESTDAERQVEFLGEQLALIKEMEAFSNEEKIVAEEAVNQRIKELNQEIMENKAETSNAILKTTENLFNTIGTILKMAGKDSRAFAILEKSMALAQIAINTGVAVSKALTSGPPPANFIQAALVGSAGAAQAATVISTMIPSAETGGRFIVPQSTGVDNTLMRVNSGEEVSVTPRGMTNGNESFNFNFIMDGHVFSEIINKQARAGELYTLQLAGNL